MLRNPGSPLLHDVPFQPSHVLDNGSNSASAVINVISYEPPTALKHGTASCKTNPQGPIANAIGGLQFEMDVRSVGALRIALALLTLHDLYIRATDTMDWMAVGPGPHLLDPADTPHHAPIHAQLFARGSYLGAYLHLLLCAVLAVLLLVGKWRPQRCAALLYFAMACLQAKTQHFHDGSDKLLRHMLAWSAFLPLGVRFIPSEDKSIAPAGDVLVRGVGVAGLQLQLLCMYWSLLSRRHGSKWYGPDFSAIYYILMNPFIGGAWGKALAQNLPELCRVLTALSMFAEFLAPLVGALAPATRWWRILPAVALTGLHLGIYLTTNLTNFPLLAMACNLVYIPAPVWDLWSATREPWEDGKDKPRRARGDHKGWGWSERVAGAMLGYMVYKCLADCHWLPNVDGGNVGEFVRLNQNWDMYSPSVSTSGQFWVIYGRPPARKGHMDTGYDMLQWVKDGTWDQTGPRALDVPAVPSSLYRNFRWERYLHQTATDSLLPRAWNLGLWLCWEAKTTLAVDWGEVQIVIRSVDIAPPGVRPPYTNVWTAHNMTVSCHEATLREVDAHGREQEPLNLGELGIGLGG